MEYKAYSLGAGALGAAWSHTYSRSVTVNSDGTIDVLRPGGGHLTWKNSGTSYVADADVPDRLQSDGSGWRYINAQDDSVETYDATGKLLSIAARNGQTQTLRYSDPAQGPLVSLLTQVTDTWGRTLSFAYDGQGRITQMTDPSGNVYGFAYDEVSSVVTAGQQSGNNLTSVTFPDGKKRIYWYNEQDKTDNTNLPNALTGITDENGARYSTYKYSQYGGVLSTEHAGGVEKYFFNYKSDNSQTTVTDPLGSQRIYYFQSILGVIKRTDQSQPAGSGCPSALNSIRYDANGNVNLSIDFNGNKTTYSYDLMRNLMTGWVEASGTALARTVTTEWHPTYRLPARVAEPKRLTTYTYDANGNLLTKTVQATSDSNGAQGFGATLVGSPRIWSYTYNAAGQILTETGPRTDVVDKTSYTYDDKGNLASVTNAAGHVTTLSNYDPDGRVGRIVDPNGLITDLTYSSRGWLTSMTVGSETTGYDYDGVGQRKKVTPPDGSSLNYTYDDAHRLTAIADSLGNSIVYTLDKMGNRINEQVKDPAGVLARKTTRVYDALNRMSKITGGVQ